MPLLQRYLFKELIQIFLLCVSSLMTLILMARALHMRELFLGLDLEGTDLVLLFLYLMPSFLLIILPISCMLSVFLTFLRLNSDRELVALKAGGISIYQLLFAPAFFSFLCMLVAFLISIHGIAWGMGSFRTLVLHIASTRAKVIVQPGVFNQDIIKGLTLFARNVDPISGKLKQVIFEDNRQENSDKSMTIIAPEGEIVTDEEKGQLVFKLQNGRIYRMDDDGISILSFSDYAINIDLSNLFSTIDMGDVKPKEMTWAMLKDATLGKGDISEKNRLKAGVEIQKRLALPVSCFVLGIFVLPLACSVEDVKRQTGVFLSLIMFLLYYSIFSVGLSLGESGTLPPEVGLWMANVFFAFLAGISLYLTAKERIFSPKKVFFFLFDSLQKRIKKV